LRVAGLSSGFALFDDVGSEYERHGETFAYHPFPNRFFSSRESGVDRGPQMRLVLGAADHEAPEIVGDLVLDAHDLAAGEIAAAWTTPRDRGPAGTLGFFARFQESEPSAEPRRFDWETARPVALDRVPPAGAPGERESLRLGGFAPGGRVTLGLRAVDAAGNLGPIAIAEGHASSGWSVPAIEVPSAPAAAGPHASPRSIGPGSSTARLGAAEVVVVDALDVVNLRTGALVPAREPEYRTENALWSAADRSVHLAAARNEFAAVQIVISRPFDGVHAEVEFDDASMQARLFAGRGVSVAGGRCVDPLVPWPCSSPRAPLPTTRALDELAQPDASDRCVAVFLDVYVPHEAARGPHSGKLVLTRGADRLEIALRVNVWAFTLPDRLSFVPEMNAYSLPDPPAERGWYRLAHEHRTCLNRLGYDWGGRPSAGCAPGIAATGSAASGSGAPGSGANDFEWTAFDARFGPLLDGSAFADLPRAKAPVDTFYLPLNENWPVPVEEHFHGGYWADEALDSKYFEHFAHASALWAEHVRERRWTAPLFECYLNGKVYYKEKGWSRCSAPWIFDEPTHAQDFWALSCFARAFHAGVDGRAGDAKLAFRVDLSRPEWRRDLLDGLVDVSVVGSAIVPYRDRVIEKKRRNGEIVFRYATANQVGTSNVMPDAWCLDTWCLGADGVIPWQTIGTERSWSTGDPLALLYPGGPAGLADPVPSARLKAFRRGEQDVEYLVLWAQALGVPREAVAERVLATLPLQASGAPVASGASGAANDEAGELVYPALSPERLELFRRALGRKLDALAPPPREQLVDLRSPARDAAHAPVRTTVLRR
jgi:hypothetical protein